MAARFLPCLVSVLLNNYRNPNQRHSKCVLHCDCSNGETGQRAPLDKASTLCFNKLMNKTSFLQRVVQKHQKPQITQRVYHQVLKELLTSIQQELAAGRTVQFLGFGTFSTRMHKGGRGRNFKTNKPIEYKAVRIPAFRPGSLLKKAVRKKK